MAKEMRTRISMLSTKLVKQLKRRDKHAYKLQRNFDVLTAILQAVSLKRRKYQNRISHTRITSRWEILISSISLISYLGIVCASFKSKSTWNKTHLEITEFQGTGSLCGKLINFIPIFQRRPQYYLTMISISNLSTKVAVIVEAGIKLESLSLQLGEFFLSRFKKYFLTSDSSVVPLNNSAFVFQCVHLCVDSSSK